MPPTVDTRAEDASVLRHTIAAINTLYDHDKFVTDLYRNLFTARPDLRHLFPADGPDMTNHQDKIWNALVSLARYYDQPDFLTPVLEGMGARHTGYGATLDGYAAVGTALITTLQQTMRQGWTPRFAGPWDRAIMFTVGTMAAAGAVTRRTAASHR